MALGGIINLAFDVRSHDVISTEISEMHTTPIKVTSAHCLINAYAFEITIKIGLVLLLMCFCDYIESYLKLPVKLDFQTCLVIVVFCMSRIASELAPAILRVIGRTRLIAGLAIVDMTAKIACVSFIGEKYIAANWLVVLFVTSIIALITSVSTIVLALWLCGIRKTHILKWSLKHYWTYFKGRWKMFLTNLGTSWGDMMSRDLDLVISSQLLTPHQIGIYKLGKVLAQTVWRMGDSIMYSLIPEFNLYIKNNDEYNLRRIIKKSIAISVAISVSVSIVMTLSVYLFGAMVFGGHFGVVYKIVPYFCFGIIISSTFIWGYPLAVATRSMGFIFMGSTVSGIFGVAILNLLVSNYKEYGAAFAWSITVALNLAIISCLSWGRYKVRKTDIS